jgi:hypothetical protein
LKKDIMGIFVTEYDNPEKATAATSAMKNCPHLVTAGTSGNIGSMTFIVPESLRGGLRDQRRILNYWVQ